MRPRTAAGGASGTTVRDEAAGGMGLVTGSAMRIPNGAMGYPPWIGSPEGRRCRPLYSRKEPVLPETWLFRGPPAFVPA